jgi:hypothetical protein
VRISHSLPGLALATLIASYASASFAEPPPPPPPPPDEPGHPGAHHHKGHADPKAHHADHDGGHESEYPLSYTERPLTLSKMTLAPELVFNVGHLGGTTFGMEIGAAFGITKDFEIGAVVLPMDFAPSPVRYGAPQIFATYRFFHSPTVEIGGRLRAAIYHEGVTGAAITPSVPFLFHLGKIARLDLEPGVVISANRVPVGSTGTLTGGSTYVGLSVPVQFAIDIIEPLHVGVNTGIIAGDFGHFGDSVTVPLGFFAGYAIGGKKPVVDIDPFFRWDAFLMPGVGAGVDKVNAGIWNVGLNIRAYIYL